ncbi:MAG: flagellar biosynthesis protein FlhB [Thermoguttaceae bacterium]|nr:flagellar biosynthesis protein FlhB [Thermoguttaceae bacterium]MDW8037278.1 flagellar biosynthesis protein FlhB [Thermoguttaceae bacterium]
MPEYAGEKTHEPTYHRRQKAREEGHVARSHDFASALLLLIGVVLVVLLGRHMLGGLVEFSQHCWESTIELQADVLWVVGCWNGVCMELAKVVLPFLGLMMIAGILVHVIQTGILFVPQRLSPQLDRINPLQGMRRIFSFANLLHTVFGMIKIAVIGVVAWAVLASQWQTILGLAGMELGRGASYMAQIILSTTFKIALALLILALLDYGYQKWRYEQDLKMTTQELREEMRNLEGDPHVIARRKAVQRQLALQRLSSAVPKADVVITNPTELAVALRYEPEEMIAPIVVAKGAGVLAQRIRRLAIEHDIPIVERKELAQALYREVDVGKPIPEDKYAAVAEVLAYVYQLKGKSIPAPPSQAA